jgi:T5SS/PEP-CTERM-associated repeat protein/autotransporter-associated beta strand protein
MRSFLVATSVALLLLLSTAASTFADSATWTGATDGNWDTLTNWTANPNPVPNGIADVASFGSSGTTGIFLSTNVILDSAIFNFGASAYTITANSGSLDFQGAGVMNNSGVTQNFATTNAIQFHNSATAGTMTAYTTSGSGSVQFYNNSDAASATFTNNGAGSTQFNNNSTAASATINNSGAGSYAAFSGTATAADATITNSGAGSSTVLSGTASGGNATLVNNNATALIDISGLTNGGTTVGSIAGNGAIYLGGNNLTVGTNNTSTTFSGVIQDGPNPGGSPLPLEGQLTKVGTGTLTLTALNTYTGTTTVEGGVLEVTSSGAINSISGLYAADFAGSNGTLNITSGGTVSTAFGSIGSSGGIGTVTVSGSTSTWINSNFFGPSAIHVGEFGGTGTMNVLNGGTVSSGGGLIGDVGTGTVTVNGAGSSWTSSGDLQVGDVGTGTMSVTAGGTVTNNNATIGNSGTGTVTVDGVGSTWTNNGFLTVSTSGTNTTLSITHGGKVSASDGTGVNDQGTVTVGTVPGDAALLVSPTVFVDTGGLLKGTGTIKGTDMGGPSVLTNNGIVSPGDGASLGTLHLTGSYVQTSGGTFSIAIGSLSFFDALEVSGTAMLDGTLNVTLAGYTGNYGDVFTILTSSGLGGTNFANIYLPSLSAGLYLHERTDGNNVELYVNDVVPEPSTWAAGLLMAGTLVFLSCRRRAVASSAE